MIFLPEKKTVAFEPGDSVLEVSQKNKLGLKTSCGGMGTCTACRVIVESDLKKLEPRNEVEQEMADSRGFFENERLGCQLSASPGLCVRIPED